MHHAMQVLYRPVDINVRGRYNIKEYNAITDDTMKEMPLAYALGAVFFLLNLGKELSVTMMDYLQKGVLKEHTPLKEGLIENGVGIHHFTKQLKEMLGRFEHISELRITHKVLMYLEFVNEKQHIRESENKKKIWQ